MYFFFPSFLSQTYVLSLSPIFWSFHISFRDSEFIRVVMDACCCDLQVDVNGEGVFLVDKGILCNFSRKLSKLLHKSTSTKSSLKVIFHDFPGGAESFELIARFCYNNGSIETNPPNLVLLHSAAQFMEMCGRSPTPSAADNLIEQTEKSIQEITHWSWSDLIVALKQCQDLRRLDNSTVDVITNYCMDTLIGRVTLASESSSCPTASSPDSSGFRISCDSRSTESLRTNCSRGASWWFDDLLALDHDSVRSLVRCMVSRKLDHAVISRFLFYYQKVKVVHGGLADDRCKIMDMVIEMLCALDLSSVSYKSLFGILRVSLNLGMSKCSRQDILEVMIGSRLDEATLDNLLVPSPCGVNYLYDVSLVLRFLKSFSGGKVMKNSPDRVRKVSNLMDLYLAEVAPDPCLKPMKFIALAMALPDSARESYDNMYQAIDMYLEVHPGLSEEEKLNICCVLNYEKLSSEACMHIADNKKFPPRSALQALISQQNKLKCLLRDSKSCTASPCATTSSENRIKGAMYEDERDEQVVVFAGKVDVASENEKLRAHLQGMQCRVTELEKICRKMQNQMRKMTKSKSSNYLSPRALPKLCS